MPPLPLIPASLPGQLPYPGNRILSAEFRGPPGAALSGNPGAEPNPVAAPVRRYHPTMPNYPGRTRALPFAAEAVAGLSAADPKLARLIERVGPITLRLPAVPSPFESLARSIIYQQLHGKAAAAIHLRMIQSFSPIPEATALLGPHPTPQQLLDCPNEQLRAAGLSANKALALRDLAAKTLDGTVPTLAQARRMSDDDLITHLTAVRGVGRWTVEMFLIFALGRPDLLPVDDYGVRKGFALTFGKRRSTSSGTANKITPADLPKPDVMLRRARRWQPFRSVASWYLWRAADLGDAPPK